MDDRQVADAAPRWNLRCQHCGTKGTIDVEPYVATTLWCPKCKKVVKRWPVQYSLSEARAEIARWSKLAIENATKAHFAEQEHARAEAAESELHELREGLRKIADYPPMSASTHVMRAIARDTLLTAPPATEDPTGDWPLRVFKPLPPEEAAGLRATLDESAPAATNVPTRIDPPLDAIDDAAALCESESRKWESSESQPGRRTHEHWSAVAIQLRGFALAERVRAELSAPAVTYQGDVRDE